MFLTGFSIFLGLLFVMAKLRRRLVLRLLHHDALLDVAVTLLVLYVHWGSFEGVMAATIAGLFTSLATSLAKRLFGHIEGGLYHPGHFHLKV